MPLALTTKIIPVFVRTKMHKNIPSRAFSFRNFPGTRRPLEREEMERMESGGYEGRRKEVERQEECEGGEGRVGRNGEVEFPVDEFLGAPLEVSKIDVT